MNAPDLGAQVKAADRRHVFHSWSAQGMIDPVAIAGAEGSWMWDFDGKRYLDFSSQLVNVNKIGRASCRERVLMPV